MSKISKEKYESLAEELRVNLINAQYDLKNSNSSVVLLLAGNDLPGCEEFIDVLQEWVDVRYVETRAFRQPTEEELQHPPLWRYWQSVPPDGRMAVFYGAWVMNLVLECYNKTIDDDALALRLSRLSALENLLRADGKKVLKVWLHASDKDLKKRLKKAKANPDSELYVGQFHEQIYQVYKSADDIVEKLNSLLTEDVPWQWIDGSDKKMRNLTIAQRLLAVMESEPKPPKVNKFDYLPASVDHLAQVDLSKTVSYVAYKKQLKEAQLMFKQIVARAREAKVTPILAFEGWDAAGKGGVIRRITRAMSAWAYRVIPIAAPTQDELKYHYLWRFWKHIPRAGKVVIFDRTWYGRVLVERVEGYAKPSEWQRAYREINEFEAHLVESRCCVLKFWLHIDEEEQLNRFKQRESTQYKKYKITEDDYRNREKWPDYVAAVNDMVSLTSVDGAAWHLIPANSKRYARLKVLKTVCAELESFIEKIEKIDKKKKNKERKKK